MNRYRSCKEETSHRNGASEGCREACLTEADLDLVSRSVLIAESCLDYQCKC